MKYYIYSFFSILIYVLTFNNCNGQDTRFTGKTPCSGYLYLKSPLFENFPELEYSDFLKNYISTTFPGSQYFICFSPENLLKYRNQVNLPNEQVFELNLNQINYRISIFLKQKKYFMDVTDIEQDEYLIIENMVEDSLGYNYFGSFKKDSILSIKYIDKIVLIANNEEIAFYDEENFQGLINPNTCLKFNGLRPIEVYFSLEHQKFFIYIFGEINFNNLMKGDYSYAKDSYLAKIIIDPKVPDKSILNVIPGGYLGTYGWLECKEYDKWWGF